MQQRRREGAFAGKPAGAAEVLVPPAYWEELAAADLELIERRAPAGRLFGKSLVLRVLGEDLLVDAPGKRIYGMGAEGLAERDDPLLRLLVLVYLLNCREAPLAGVLAAPRDLASGHFFTEPHAIETGALVKTFGADPERFARAALRLGGEKQDLGGLAYTLLPFPRIPLTYVLWLGDGEFPPSFSLLFDKSVERHLAPDAVWGVTGLVTRALLRAAAS
jgi:hypothetical protein